jgi:hypothetical protein
LRIWRTNEICLYGAPIFAHLGAPFFGEKLNKPRGFLSNFKSFFTQKYRKRRKSTFLRIEAHQIWLYGARKYLGLRSVKSSLGP